MSDVGDQHPQGNPLTKSWHGYTVAQSRDGCPAYMLETVPLIIPHPSLKSYLGIGGLAAGLLPVNWNKLPELGSAEPVLRPPYVPHNCQPCRNYAYKQKFFLGVENRDQIAFTHGRDSSSRETRFNERRQWQKNYN
jgi:hypothetical protein